MARILLVDDEILIGLSALAALEAAGHEVRYARHGKEALGLLDDFAPDVLLTDLMMPIMDGQQLVRAVMDRTDGPRPRVVIMSAVPREILAKRHPEFTHHTLLQKPFSDEQLFRAVLASAP